MASHKADTKQNAPQSNNDQSSESPSPNDVAEEFGRDYYGCLSANPREIGKYYKEDSVFTIMTEGSSEGLQERITGINSIREKLQNSGLATYRVKLPVFQAQESINGSILILAKGIFVKGKVDSRPFVQTFLLAPQHPAGWYVKNDVLVFLSESASAATSSGTAAQSGFQQNSSNVSSNSASSAVTSATSTSQTSSTSAPAQAAPAAHDIHRKDQPSSAASSAAPSQTNAASPSGNTAPRSAAAVASNASGADKQHQQAASNVNASAQGSGSGDKAFGRPTGAQASTTTQQQGSNTQNARPQQDNSSQQQQQQTQQQGSRRPAGFGRNNKGKEKDESELAHGEKPKNSWASIVAASGTNSPPIGVDMSPTGQVRSAGTVTPKSPIAEVTTVRVRNLPYDSTEQQVIDLFKQYGDITKVKMNKGYCFIEFASNAGVKNATSAQDLSLENRPLQIDEKATKQVRRGVTFDGKRVGMGDQNRPRDRDRKGGRGDGRGGRGGGDRGGRGGGDRGGRGGQGAQSAQNAQSGLGSQGNQGGLGRRDN